MGFLLSKWAFYYSNELFTIQMGFSLSNWAVYYPNGLFIIQMGFSLSQWAFQYPNGICMIPYGLFVILKSFLIYRELFNILIELDIEETLTGEKLRTIFSQLWLFITEFWKF
jgi:hypothetical protein